jgi:chromosome segregation ATPase
MNRLVRKEFVLVLCSYLIVMLIAGCEQQNLSSEKKNRFIAYENKSLKEQLAQQEKKIEEQDRLLKECQQNREILEKKLENEQQQEKKIGEQLAQREKKIEEQDRLLKECQQRREILEDKFNETVGTAVSGAMGMFKQSDEQIERENNELKAQVEELKAQISKLEQQLKNASSPSWP